MTYALNKSGAIKAEVDWVDVIDEQGHSKPLSLSESLIDALEAVLECCAAFGQSAR